ncbi:MAG: ATP-binding protein [Verrucomicrobiota bacterium]|jgi:predicted ATPase
MELFHLTLKRFVVANYRSVKRVELDHLNNMVWLVGRNNAGKSNLLDAFQFLSDASTSFERALASRGGDLAQVIHRKKPHLKMEFVFEFALAADKRAELVRQLFADNPHMTAEEALATDFLSALTLQVVVGRDHVTEDLTASNLRGDRPCLIFSIKSTPKKTEILHGQIEALCKRCKDQLPSEPVVPDLPPEPSQPFRLRLGRPESGAVFPVSNELADGVRRQFTALEWTAPPSPAPSGEGRERSLAAEASNLPDVLHWVYNNKPSQFRRIEAQVQKLVPRLGKLHTPTLRNETTLALIDPRDEDLVYSLGQMSSGTRSLVALVAKVLLAAPGAWICVEEPEHCLHPQAQTRLLQFLRSESAHKRIFGASHAPAFAAASPLSSLFLVRRDADNCTVAAAVTPDNARTVIEELGVGASFSFESDAVVFVEEADHVPVFEAWARKLGSRARVQFLSCDGADNLHYHANARIALSQRVRTLVFAVFGNGSTGARKTLTRHLELAEDQIVTLDYPELEGCLLDAKAIRKAFPTIPLSEAELQARLDPALVLAEQKNALLELLAEFKFGDYDGQLGGRIAEAMEAVPADVAQLFARIEAGAKPFWEI